MRRAFIFVIIAFALLTGQAFAAPDYGCVTGYLEGTAYAVGPKAKQDLVLSKSAEFRSRLELEEVLAVLGPESLDAWCAYLSSDAGIAAHQVARIDLYSISLKDLPDLDDGVGPMPFDFAKYKLATRYNGLDCGYVIADPLHKAEGRFNIQDGRFTFHDGEWFIGGSASSDDFNRFNVAITEDGSLVGKLPIYLNVVDTGEVAQETHTVVLNGKQGKLGREMPVGIVKLPVDVDAPVKLYVVGCVTAGQAVDEQYAFDFSGFKIDEKVDKMLCGLQIASLDPDPYSVGSAQIEFTKGFGKFGFGAWATNAPSSAYKRGNLAITTDRKLVGLIDVWRMFQEAGKIKPPSLVVLDGKSKALSKDLKGTLTAATDKNASVSITLGNCRPQH
ncbi:MAG: hypothetical protein ABIQ30_11685 [Devosia sp.]